MKLSEERKRILRELGRIRSGRGFEESAFWLGLGLTIALTVSGVWLFFVDALEHVDHAMLLFHIIGGFPFVVPVVMLAMRHRRYTEIIGGKGFAWGGWATAFTMAVTFISGVWLVFRGVTGVYWLWFSHALVSVVAVVGLVWYIIKILAVFKKNLPDNDRANSFFRALFNMLSKRVGAIAVMALSLVVALGMVYTEPDHQIEVPDYTYVSEGEPFFPSRATGEGGFYNPEHFLNSDSCGNSGCHEATTKQWKDSVHYLTPTPVFAAVEALFKEEARKGEVIQDRDLLVVEGERSIHGGEESFRFCGGCHTPVALFAGEMDIGESLPSFEEREGVSCIFCHRIEATGEKSDGGGGDYRISAPPDRYLFAFTDNPVGVWLNNVMINSKPEHHKQMFMKPSYSQSEYCYGCHKRLQYTYWKDSVYADESHSDHKECQDCHFDDVEVTDDVSAYVDGVVADHRSLGANLVTPMIYGLTEQYRLTMEFMSDENQTLMVLAPKAVGADSTLLLGVHVVNKGAGHTFPSGPESDLIEAWTEVIVKDQAGSVLFAYGLLDDQGHLDHEETYVYSVRPYDKDGKMLELDRHRNWLFTEDRMHVLPAKGYDQHVFEIPVPAGLSGELSVSIRLRFRKFNQSFLDFAAAGGFMERIVAPVVELDTEAFTVALSSDSAVLSSAQAQFLTELETPPGLDEYEKKPSLNDYILSTKLSLDEQVALKEAGSLFKQERFEEALAKLDRISSQNKNKKRIKAIRQKLESAVAENLEMGGRDVRVFDKY